MVVPCILRCVSRTVPVMRVSQVLFTGRPNEYSSAATCMAVLDAEVVSVRAMVVALTGLLRKISRIMSCHAVMSVSLGPMAAMMASSVVLSMAVMWMPRFALIHCSRRSLTTSSTAFISLLVTDLTGETIDTASG